MAILNPSVSRLSSLATHLVAICALNLPLPTTVAPLIRALGFQAVHSVVRKSDPGDECGKCTEGEED